MTHTATQRVLFSSRSDDWATPPDVYATLNAEFLFTLDPCASDENHKCEQYFTVADDGLSKEWAPHRVFMNPPYGRTVGLWMEKALSESRRGALVVCLVPSRTDTAWWHDYVQGKGEVRFYRGRLRFGDGRCSAPFPSALVVYRP